MKNAHLKNISGLLLATLFISTSGVLGRYIAMPTEVIIWFRAAIAMMLIYLYCKYKKIDLTIKSPKNYKPFFISGLLMAVHWVTYFYALKLFILTPEFNIDSTQVKGILFGVFSAFCYAVRILILKQHVAKYNGTMLMFYQTVIITILLLPTLFFMDISGLESQFPYLLLLAFLTTAIGHSLMLHSLKFFSASTASVISSLQPIFGIILAFFFLQEIPTMRTFWGGSLILLTVVIESVRSRNKFKV